MALKPLRGALLGLLLAAPAGAETLQGIALLRERIALPDGLVFEAVIEDVARADAPARRIAATRFETSGQPPFAFAIDYDPAALEPQGRHVLRATLHRDGRLFATTDTVHPVLRAGRPEPVEVVLSIVSARADVPEQPLPAHGLDLPASFTGTLPCADCAGIRHHLDLWPDQVYQLSREWLGRPGGPLRRDEVGRWHADPGRGAIVLHGAAEMPLFWQVVAPDRLRQMDMQGNPLAAAAGHELSSDGRFAPTDLAALFLTGEARSGPDGPALRECLTGRVFPIDRDGDFPALAAALEATPTGPGGPLLVNLEARIAQPPPGLGLQFPRLTVLRFNAAFPGQACPRPQSTAELVNTYWRFDRLRDEAVPRLPGVREAHLILRGGDDRRLAATVGCNRLLGSYTLAGEALTLTAGASTLMACPPQLDTLERSLRAVLQATRRYRLSGQQLELLDADGTTLAVLGAVYLR
jgi:copper homeostasis protein (lipoprotein)